MSEEAINEAVENEGVASPQEQPEADSISVENAKQPINDQEKNWAALRQAKEDSDKTISNLQSQVEELKSMVQPQASPKQESLSNDDFMTYGDFLKIQQQKEIEATPKKYSDYYDVVKNYTDKFIQENPEMEHVILKSPNPRETAYKMAKMYAKANGLDVPSKANGEKAKENLQKPPTSIQATQTVSALHDMGQYQSMPSTRRDEIWKQAQIYSQGR